MSNYDTIEKTNKSLSQGVYQANPVFVTTAYEQDALSPAVKKFVMDHHYLIF